MKVKISLGSNINQTDNICKAKKLLANIFPDIQFSKTIWTDPICIKSEKYLNCTGKLTTTLSKKQLILILKKIEQTMGDNHTNHKLGKIIIDIDLNIYGTELVKPIIWQNNHSDVHAKA